MYNPRKYRCLRCWRKFALADGIVCQPSVGAVCPHCGSRLTVSRWH